MSRWLTDTHSRTRQRTYLKTQCTEVAAAIAARLEPGGTRTEGIVEVGQGKFGNPPASYCPSSPL